MEICEAKEKVVLAGKRLVETGLIARTWGNVSCRVDENKFVITPSGRAYETLTPDEIVTVNINDESFEGSIEPSSEKGVHAAAYSERKDINFIIHTHQLNASALSPLGLNIEVISSEAFDALGGNIIFVPYGLPGTKTLKMNVASAISSTGSKAYLMQAHGALCLGENDEEAFSVASMMEKVCHDYLVNRYLEVSDRSSFNPDELKDYYVNHYGNQGFTAGLEVKYLYCSVREGDSFSFYLSGGETMAPKSCNPEPKSDVKISLENPDYGNIEEREAAAIHCAIYRKRNDLGAIVHSLLPDILSVSRTGRAVYPMIDDFAQIIGVNTRVAFPDYKATPEKVAGEILSKMKKRHAVILAGNGALCCGPDSSDAVAAEIIFEKNCRAVIAADLFGRGRPINPRECLLMRHIYLTRYSKLATSAK